MGVFKEKINETDTLDDLYNNLEEIKFLHNKNHFDDPFLILQEKKKQINEFNITKDFLTHMGFLKPTALQYVKFLQNTSKFWKEIHEFDKRPM